MVERQIRQRGVADTRVLSAMETIPRERFVPPDAHAQAYDDVPLAIGFNQTISQPYIVAYMTEVLDVRESHRVLEIGTGSAYQAAVLASLAREVWTIEIVPELAASASELLRDLGLNNVHVRLGDGYSGWPEQAPFDRIMVTAAPDDIPDPLDRTTRCWWPSCHPGWFSRRAAVDDGCREVEQRRGAEPHDPGPVRAADQGPETVRLTFPGPVRNKGA